MRPLEISGTTGEGGGQLVRTAIALSALTGQAVTISDIRGGRERGGECCAAPEAPGRFAYDSQGSGASTPLRSSSLQRQQTRTSRA